MNQYMLIETVVFLMSKFHIITLMCTLFMMRQINIMFLICIPVGIFNMFLGWYWFKNCVIFEVLYFVVKISYIFPSTGTYVTLFLHIGVIVRPNSCFIAVIKIIKTVKLPSLSCDCTAWCLANAHAISLICDRLWARFLSNK